MNMKDFVIFGDSTCDLSIDLRQQYNLEYIPMCYMIDEDTFPASLDWEHHSVKEFFDIIRDGKRIFTTQIPKELCAQKFTEAIESGKDVVYISCSSALSKSIDVARVVAQELKGTYPDAGIYCVDSLNSSMAQGAMLITASQMRAEGKSAEETAKHIEQTRLCYNLVGYCNTLAYLARSGRVKASKAFFGNLFGVKPIIISDVNGYQTAFKKVKGREKSLREIVAMLADSIVEPEEQTLYFAHADCEEEEVESIVAMLREAIPARRIVVGYIGPIIGASIGPDAVAIFGFGKPVTVNQGE
jgi:DegV family protein with EDD domain